MANAPDEFSEYISSLLAGRYDCVDRIALRGFFPMGQTSGGLLSWWNRLRGNTPLSEKALRQMAGEFSRRLRAYCRKHQIPVKYCPVGDKTKHAQAEKFRPKDPNFQGLFLVLVAKAPALVWKVWKNPKGKLVVRRPKNWPLANHFHFHIIDKEWGHLTIRMSGHPPFGLQILLNGHEWVQGQAQKQSISWVKEGNCFVGGSDLPALSRLAEGLDGPQGLAQLARVCDRWVYTSCLCFALSGPEQERSGFHYRYSCFQLEYSRNLLFKSGRRLDELYQGLIDRSRRLLDVRRLRTIFGRKKRPFRTKNGSGRLEKIIEQFDYELTVFKVHFGKLTLKMYDKGERVLRVEVIVHDVKELRCGKLLDKLPGMLKRLEAMVVEFLGVVQSAHLSFLENRRWEQLSRPTVLGQSRLAGVDLEKPRMRAVSEALLALAPAPDGFTTADLVAKVRAQQGRPMARYHRRQAAYDLRKLRGKSLVRRLPHTRRYRIRRPGIRTLSGLLILREKVIKPVLAGLCSKPGRPPKNSHPIDLRYRVLQREMRHTLRFLKIAA